MFDEAGGGGPVLQTETEDLHAAAVECSNKAIVLNGMVSNLMGRLEVMSDALVGLSGNKFEQLKHDVGAQMKLLNDALDDIGERVGIAEVNYAQGDEEAQSTLAAVDAEPSNIERALYA